ncbi:MAG TPA: hypothetical protein VGO62_19995, partial [Myxococcota bacterium]
MSGEVDAAVAAAVGALLLDKDVSELAALEGGFVEVLRRGRRERLAALLDGPLFALLRDELASSSSTSTNGSIDRMLAGGHRLIAGVLVDGRIALRIDKKPVLDASLERLLEEGVLPPGVGAELTTAVLEGAGVLVLGPARAARQRVLVAVVRALQGKLALFGVTDSLASLLPVPATNTTGAPDLIVARGRDAIALGADAL